MVSCILYAPAQLISLACSFQWSFFEFWLGMRARGKCIGGSYLESRSLFDDFFL